MQNPHEEKKCDKNGHLIDKSGSLINDANCSFCSQTSWSEEAMIKKFDELKLGCLDWCGNEDHTCECSVKETEIKDFLKSQLHSFALVAIGEIENMKKEREHIMHIRSTDGLEDLHGVGFVSALDAAKEVIKSLMKN